MLAEQFTSMSDNTQGEWETREVYVADERLNPRESLAVARHTAHGFGSGDGRSGAAQLAFALLLGATETASAVAHCQAFKWEGMLGTQAGRSAGEGLCGRPAWSGRRAPVIWPERTLQ